MSPQSVVTLCSEAGLSLIAISDHESIAGLNEGRLAGQQLGVTVAAGIELDIDYEQELHILLYCFDETAPDLLELIKKAHAARKSRDIAIRDKLKHMGMPLEECTDPNYHLISIVQDMVHKGYAASPREAFINYVGANGSAHVPRPKPGIDEAMEIAAACHGLSVLAHPAKCGYGKELIGKLADRGLWGIEAYYPQHTKQQTESYIVLAEQFNLVITAGSDFHGAHRKENAIAAVSSQATHPLAIKAADEIEARLPKYSA